MIQVPLSEIVDKVQSHLLGIGFTRSDAERYAEVVVEQEIVGNRFSPLAELKGKHARMTDAYSGQKAEVVMEKAAAMLVRGNGRPAPLITLDYLDMVIDKAKSQGMYALGIFDATYNDFFDIFCRRIAARDCIGLIVENGGPQGVVPYGGKSDVTGTNPLAYGVPTNDLPIVFDAATAMYAYGLIRQAKERGEPLPADAYVDKNGALTTDPQAAHAVLPFGGYKGWAINILIDILSGSMVRAKSGLDMPQEADRHIGTFMIVIDPASFGDINEFKNATTKLCGDILAVESVSGKDPVRIPGFRGGERLRKARQQGYAEIDEAVWKQFINLSA